MATTIDIDLETGDTSQFTSTTGTGLSASGAAKMGGSYGLAVALTDSSDRFGTKTLNKSTTFRIRFYFDPNGLTMSQNDLFTIGHLGQNGGSYSDILVTKLYRSDTAFVIIQQYCDDAGDGPDDGFEITDAPHYIEIKFVQATNSTSNDGTFQWWLDGADQGQVTGIDNYNLMSDQNWRWNTGAVWGLDAGTSGTLYIDEIIANDDGGTIGPYTVDYVMTVDAGSYAITGSAITATRATQMTVAAGSYAITGSAVTLQRAINLVAAAGSYALTGSAVGMVRATNMITEAGVYSLTGNDVTFPRLINLTADAGSYTLTGNDVILQRAINMIVDSGSYAISGNAIELIRSIVMGVDSGTYTLTGRDVTFPFGRVMSVDAGVYLLTGNNVDFPISRVMSVDVGGYVLTGLDVDLIYTSGGTAYVMTVEAGVYTLIGLGVDLIHLGSISPAVRKYEAVSSPRAQAEVYRITETTASHADAKPKNIYTASNAKTEEA